MMVRWIVHTHNPPWIKEGDGAEPDHAMPPAHLPRRSLTDNKFYLNKSDLSPLAHGTQVSKMDESDRVLVSCAHYHRLPAPLGPSGVTAAGIRKSISHALPGGALGL